MKMFNSFSFIVRSYVFSNINKTKWINALKFEIYHIGSYWGNEISSGLEIGHEANKLADLPFINSISSLVKAGKLGLIYPFLLLFSIITSSILGGHPPSLE